MSFFDNKPKYREITRSIKEIYKYSNKITENDKISKNSMV